MNQLRIISDSGLEPTKEELEKIQDLNLMLRDHLASTESVSLSEPVRQALEKYSTDNDLLLKFVRGRKQNLQKAHDSLISFANVKHKVYPELFPTQVPDFVRHIIKNEILTILSNRDSLGRTIILFRISKWDVQSISLEDIICAGRYIADALMNLPEFLRKGTVLLTDCNGATLNHVRQFTIPIIAKFVNVFWKAYPIQIKGMIFVNSPFFVKPVWTISKPFLPGKLRERVLIASVSGISDLYKRIEPEVLPQYLGGLIPDNQAFSLSFLQLPDLPDGK